MQAERTSEVELSSERKIRSILETDRVWCAYALADLYPPYRDRTHWFVAENAVVMVYSGLSPALLFAHGDPIDVDELFEQVPPDRYQYALRGTDRALIRDRLEIAAERPMWRMHLHPREFPGLGEERAVRLGRADLPAILQLVEGNADAPDSFLPAQLADGVHYGILEGDQLVSLAGTHVMSRQAGAAAVGNVFTQPNCRGLGLATSATAAVVNELLGSGVETVVLNVGMDNAPAIRSYSKLGFWPYCGYHEGTGELQTV